eukprot:10237893-Alexandrium_andersonii.AAC.1
MRARVKSGGIDPELNSDWSVVDASARKRGSPPRLIGAWSPRNAPEHDAPHKIVGARSPVNA